MFNVLRGWVQRYFSDEEAVVLAVLLVLAFTAVLTLGGMLAPVLAGMVLAYLMQGLWLRWNACGCPRRPLSGWCLHCLWGCCWCFWWWCCRCCGTS